MFGNDLTDVWQRIQGVSYWQNKCMHRLQSSGKQPLVAASVLFGAQDSQAMTSIIYIYICTNSYTHVCRWVASSFAWCQQSAGSRIGCFCLQQGLLNTARDHEKIADKSPAYSGNLVFDLQ